MPINILVVDDDETTLAVLEKILGRSGYVTFAATNGQNAINMLKSIPFDLILTDMVMPVRDGIEVMLHLRANRFKIPVIAISAYGAESPGNYLRIAKLFGAAATLEKPFTAEQVLAAIAGILGDKTPAQGGGE